MKSREVLYSLQTILLYSLQREQYCIDYKEDSIVSSSTVCLLGNQLRRIPSHSCSLPTVATAAGNCCCSFQTQRHHHYQHHQCQHHDNHQCSIIMIICTIFRLRYVVLKKMNMMNMMKKQRKRCQLIFLESKTCN